MTVKLPLKSAYSFGIFKGLREEVEAIRDMDIHWVGENVAYTSTLRRGFIINLFQNEGVFQEFKDQYWQFGNTIEGEKYIQFSLRLRNRYLQQRGEGEEPPEIPTGEPAISSDDEEEQLFGAETDLQNFLSKNMTVIEPGLKLYEKDGAKGIEYPVGNGRIDLLAVDTSGRFVVIELKVSEATSRVVGQLAYYMGWVDQHLGKKPCRGIIIARDITEDLCTAIRRVSDVSLMRYHLSVSVERIAVA